jgi:entry exclusion lipoprotein TrbK
MTRALLFVVIAAALAGCVESRGTTLARCKLGAMKHADDNLGQLAYTNVCMRAQGYERRANCWQPYDMAEDAKCFSSANKVARAFDALGDAIGR